MERSSRVEIPVAIGDLSYLHQGRIDVIVGLDVLARTSFGIDYRAQHVVVRAVRFASRPSAPLEIVWPFLTVRLFVPGHPMQLLVDTGSRDLVLFKSRMPAQLTADALERREDDPARLGRRARLLRYELRQVTLGDQHWDSLPGFVLDASTRPIRRGIDGVLGVLALGGTRVRFDFERGELGWSR